MSTTVMTEARKASQAVLGVVALWAATVVIGAESGFFASLYQPLIAAIVAATIIMPTVLYFRSQRLRAYAEQVGHRPIVLFHTWRIPAALLFFYFGLQGQLPPAFWILAGTGDLIAGSYAAYLMFRPESTRRYLSFHVFGFLDFVVAVGTGLTFTLLQDPRMAPIAVLPLALIPLFGVGLSGATHLIAFDMLRRGVGMARIAPTQHT
jgi:hypothetical protein